MVFRESLRRALPLVYFLVASSLIASPPSTRPVEGIREKPPTTVALTKARIVLAPGQMIESGTLVIRDGVILAVGTEVEIPAGAHIEERAGQTIYPGLLDAYSEMTVPAPNGPNGHWNALITPQSSVAEHYRGEEAVLEKLRGQGIVARLVAPAAGIWKGRSALVLTGNSPADSGVWKADVAQHLRLTVPRFRARGGYPSSPMGAVALARQTALDADWYRRAWSAYEANRAYPRPERNAALAALSPVLQPGQPVIADAANELYFLRADAFAREFSLAAIVRGSGQEYQRLDAVRSTGRAVLLPVDFPRPPAVNTPEAVRSVEVAELLHWDLAPENPRRLDAAGITVALTTDGLRDVSEYLNQVRTAVARGLPPERALRAMTVTPAELLGVADRFGTLAVGKSASLLITQGDLFDRQTKVLETWVAGRRYVIAKEPPADARGTWQVETVSSDGKPLPLTVQLQGTPDKLTGTLRSPGEGDNSKEIKLEKLAVRDRVLTGSFSGKELQMPGVIQFSAVLLQLDTPGPTLAGTWVGPDGKAVAWTAVRKAPWIPSQEPPRAEKATASVAASFPVNFPLGAFGRTGPPERPRHLLFRNATVWTCGPQGVLSPGSVLVTDGRIAAVGREVAAPPEAVVVDLSGKHLAPGIIDCHSHMATDGGVNEGTQAITAEVRVGDFVDCNDVDIYRQLAGGVTAANILHGSANPIGGQNQVIKLRWGALFDEMRFAVAPPGIKFALGENVKQSNSSSEGNPRYPLSRMGVEQIIRDAFLAAEEYREQWKRWELQHDSLPPRRDLELEALVEILEGRRWVHCHSYRQDEILALLRTCEEFGIKIATLQHILEGYKVADAMARHGAMGSSFSDWWAYKVEVYDAIPYNGALMHQAGVVVSFNSDDRELARHLNHEAAKAVKYGQIPPEEALKFVTLNAAKQLRIDQHVGSVEVGKDADLVVWSAPPLSLRARCEQTWIDGRRYFDRDQDRQLREQSLTIRSTLTQKILTSGQSPREPGETPKPDEELWPREDIYCRARAGR